MFSSLNPLPQLSKYRGPYKVGSTEFEIPTSEIESSSVIPDARVTTVKFRIFYPTTSSATSKKPITWLPEPQKAWNQAYAQFMGISERKAAWASHLPSVLSFATIPAEQDTQVLEPSNSQPYPVVIFSHGLGGNCHTYSSVVGNLASCGIICVAPEHRDGSAPTSLIRSAPKKFETTIAYQKWAHSPTVEVLNGRNDMLRVRLWELELIHTAINRMNEGKQFTNFAETVPQNNALPNFSNMLDLRPSKITWAGHSFGSATMVQFVKSVYYNKHAPPSVQSTNEEGWNFTPIYIAKANSELAKQITPESPVVLLDLWTMPLRGPATSWLWDRPLPCHERSSTTTPPNVISIISAEFYKWPEMLNRVRAVLSSDPNSTLEALAEATPDTQPSTSIADQLPTSKTPAAENLQQPVEPELTPISASSDNALTRTPSPASSRSISSSSSPSARSSTSSLPFTTESKPTSTTSDPAHLYLVPNSAHLSQSDFGPLFPNVTRYFLKALDPEKTIELNVRGVLAVMRGAGLNVADLNGGEGDGQVDCILDGTVQRFERVSLVV